MQADTSILYDVHELPRHKDEKLICQAQSPALAGTVTLFYISSAVRKCCRKNFLKIFQQELLFPAGHIILTLPCKNSYLPNRTSIFAVIGKSSTKAISVLQQFICEFQKVSNLSTFAEIPFYVIIIIIGIAAGADNFFNFSA